MCHTLFQVLYIAEEEILLRYGYVPPATTLYLLTPLAAKDARYLSRLGAPGRNSDWGALTASPSGGALQTGKQRLPEGRALSAAADLEPLSHVFAGRSVPRLSRQQSLYQTTCNWGNKQSLLRGLVGEKWSSWCRGHYRCAVTIMHNRWWLWETSTTSAHCLVKCEGNTKCSEVVIAFLP